MPKTLSLRAYAKHRGVNLQAVQDALKYGRITKAKDGKIDPRKADVDWEKNTNPAKARGSKSDSVDTGNYLKAKAVKEAYEAQLAKLEYEEKVGKLINAEKVKLQAFEIARLTRDAVLNIPDRISAELVGITDQATMHSILTKELTNALQEIVRVNAL